MDLEDARIIASHQPFMWGLHEMMAYRLATRTIERHLPVPLVLPFEHYVKVGEYRARNMTFVPYKGAYR